MLKEQYPSFAVMRKLSFGFRIILSQGQSGDPASLVGASQKTGLHSLERFVRTVKQDLRAVESAVTQSWSNDRWKVRSKSPEGTEAAGVRSCSR
jgi:hypothetical protein